MINITRVPIFRSKLRTINAFRSATRPPAEPAAVNTQPTVLQRVKTILKIVKMSILNVIRRMRDLLLVKVLYRRYTIGEGFHAGLRVRIWGREKVVIGRNFYIGRDSFIEADVMIGDNVMFGN